MAPGTGSSREREFPTRPQQLPSPEANMQLRSVVPLLLLSSVAAAQQVTLRGKVEDVPGTGGFIVDCTQTRLTGAVAPFLGQHVLVRGDVVGTNPPTVQVASIVATPEIFEIPGNPEVGNTMRFGATYTPGSRVDFYFALAPGFQPLGRSGTAFLGATARRVATGVIPQGGNLEIAVRMPNDAALIGRDVYAQAVLVSGRQVVISNPDCKEIR